MEKNAKQNGLSEWKAKLAEREKELARLEQVRRDENLKFGSYEDMMLSEKVQNARDDIMFIKHQIELLK